MPLPLPPPPRLPATKSFMLVRCWCRDKFWGISSLLRGSEGSGGNGGNKPEGGGNPVPLAAKGNLGKPAVKGEVGEAPNIGIRKRRLD